MTYTVTDTLRLAQGPVRLADHDPGSTPGASGAKGLDEELAQLGEELAELQEQMAAEAYVGGRRRVLVVLQGMDTAGKGGVVDHVFGLLSPNGLRVTSFKQPTEEELDHDFLWRIEKALPQAGTVAVFDRSHYEDVLVGRVHELADEAEIERRYRAINDWEKAQVDDGTVIIKCFLHISEETQRERLLERLADPAKQWKFKPGDVDERARWRDYEKAYEVALERSNTDPAPWYVVPGDHKKYRNWAVGQLLLEALRGMKPQWPAPDYDVEEQRGRLEQGDPEDGQGNDPENDPEKRSR